MGFATFALIVIVSDIIPVAVVNSTKMGFYKLFVCDFFSCSYPVLQG